jgi:hypothetical protein
MKEDVKEKILLRSLRGDPGVATCIQPCLVLRGGFGFSFGRRVWQRRCQPQWLIPTQQFHGTVVLDAILLRSYASPALA